MEGVFPKPVEPPESPAMSDLRSTLERFAESCEEVQEELLTAELEKQAGEIARMMLESGPNGISQLTLDSAVFKDIEEDMGELTEWAEKFRSWQEELANDGVRLSRLLGRRD